MDPVSAVGLVGSVVGIVDIITKSVAYLSGLQSSYKIADLKVKLLIGQLSTLKAALDQVASIIDSTPDIPRDNTLVNDLSVALTCVEAVILAVDDRLSELQSNENQGLKTLSKVSFVWDEQTINDYLSLLNNQVNALNLFLTALQCRTVVEQIKVVERLEYQGLLHLVRDDTSSLLWLRDSQSIGTHRSTVPQDFGTINTTFDFDAEVFASKVYRTATRSSILRNLLLDSGPDDQQGLINPTFGPLTTQVESGLHVVNAPTIYQTSVSSTSAPEEQNTGERGDNTLNTELQRLVSPTALPKYAIYTLESLQRLALVPPPIFTSPLPNASPQRVRRRKALLTRPWLARPSSPSLPSISDIQVERPKVKVLVIGTSESGKTTLIESLWVGFGRGFDDKLRRQYRPTVLRNLWGSTKAIAEAVGMEEHVAGNIPQQVREDERAFAAACDLLKEVTVDDDFSQNGLATPEFSLCTNVSSAIQTIWNNELQFHQVLDRAILHSSFGIIDAVNHFGRSSSRILDPNYVPTVEDILHSRTKTTGIYETLLVHDDSVYHFFDLGGVRSERKKWIYAFEDVNSIIFTCDVSCYDTVLIEDSNQNRMLEQIQLFDSVANDRWFIHSQIVVMFTKEDKLTARKLLASPFQNMFSDYNGHPESIEDILNYLVFRFKSVDRVGTTDGKNPHVVFCRSDSIASSTTSMGEVAMKAIQKRGSFLP